MRMLIATMALFFICSVANASPTVQITCSDVTRLYNPDVIQQISEKINEKLSKDFTIVTDSPNAEYSIEVSITSCGLGKLVNNGIGTAMSLGGSAASSWISPFGGSLIGALGFIHSTKAVFIISANVNVNHLGDKKVFYKHNFIGRSDIGKSRELTDEVLTATIEKFSDNIAKKLKRKLIRNQES